MCASAQGSFNDYATVTPPATARPDLDDPLAAAKFYTDRGALLMYYDFGRAYDCEWTTALPTAWRVYLETARQRWLARDQ